MSVSFNIVFKINQLYSVVQLKQVSGTDDFKREKKNMEERQETTLDTSLTMLIYAWRQIMMRRILYLSHRGETIVYHSDNTLNMHAVHTTCNHEGRCQSQYCEICLTKNHTGSDPLGWPALIRLPWSVWTSIWTHPADEDLCSFVSQIYCEPTKHDLHVCWPSK